MFGKEDTLNKNKDDMSSILQFLKNEEKDLLQKIEDNSLQIQQAKYFLFSMFEKEDTNFKVFSPRDVESVHKNEIDKMNHEIDVLQKENEILLSRSQMLHFCIKKLDEEDSNDEERLDVLQLLEDDRRRIAQDIHDTSLQNLTHLIHKVNLADLFIDQDPVRARMELAIVYNDLKNVIDDIRNVVYNLRPMEIDDLGLKVSLERFVSVFNENKEYDIDLDLQNVSCENEIYKTTIYRVIQECFNNIKKHAKASKIFFHWKQSSGCIYIDIEDNGIGFVYDKDTFFENKKFGISMMRERILLLKGSVSILSDMNNGTKIHIEIPT